MDKEKFQKNISDRIRICNLSSVSESMLLPLYFRAVESERSDAILKDEIAVNLIRHIDYDFSKIEGKMLTQTATMLRIREFDRFCIALLKENPDLIIVNIGSGLDTRYFRIDNGQLEWFELDLPDVIALRREFFLESDRYHFIGCSAFDFSWMDAVSGKKKQPILFLSEGVLMYLPETEVRGLFKALTKRFPGSMMVCDIVSPMQVLLSCSHPVISTMHTCFRWGLLWGKEIEAWESDIHLLRECFYLDQEVSRFRWFNTLRIFPHICRGFSILQCRLGKT